MIILRNPTATSCIDDPDVRAIVEQRFAEIGAGTDIGYMIVVEPGDSVESLEKESGCSILHNLFDDARYGDPDFAPSFEALEDHGSCYEMVFILNDDGYGLEIFIPKQEGIDTELLAMCAEYAAPAA